MSYKDVLLARAAADRMAREGRQPAPDAIGICSKCHMNAAAHYDPNRERADPWNKLLTECCGAALVQPVSPARGF